MKAWRRARRCSRLEVAECAQQLHTRSLSLIWYLCTRQRCKTQCRNRLSGHASSTTFSAPHEPMGTHGSFKTERVERVRDPQLDVFFKLYLEMGLVGLPASLSERVPFCNSFEADVLSASMVGVVSVVHRRYLTLRAHLRYSWVSSCNKSLSTVPRLPRRDSRPSDGSENICAFLSQ